MFDGCVVGVSACFSDGFRVGKAVGMKYHRYGPSVSIGTITVGTALGEVEGGRIGAVEDSAVELVVKFCTGTARGTGRIVL